MKLMRKNGGFTLVELIVVIAILAILAGIAVPAYSGYIKKAEKAADLQLLGAVNESFQAACVSEGITAVEITGASLTWNGNKVVGISSVTGADTAAIDAAFKMFYAGNEGTEFKVLANKLVRIQRQRLHQTEALHREYSLPAQRPRPQIQQHFPR